MSMTPPAPSEWLPETEDFQFGDDWSGTRFALVTAVGVWLIYLALALVRCIVYGFSNPMWLMQRHALTALCAVAMAGLLHIVLHRLENREMRVRLLAAAVLSIPPAAILSVFNYNAMYVFAPPAYIHDMGLDLRVGLLGEVLHSSIENYFVFAAWAVLWTAVSHAVGTRDLLRRMAATQAFARAAELRALRLQLDPHFLFNALNSVSGLIVAGRPDEADRAVEALSAFLRATLATNAEADVPLDDEIHLQRLYLAVEKIRFGSRLHVVFDIPDSLLKAIVPALILQPLVENSIRHAVARTSRTVTVSITAREENKLLRLVVEDDGPGGGKPGLGVGLTNVLARLDVHYLGVANLQHYRTDHATTRTVVELPLSSRLPPEALSDAVDAIDTRC
ncbi:sensor histidine kinase [Sphingomonas sp. UYP23]